MLPADTVLVQIRCKVASCRRHLMNVEHAKAPDATDEQRWHGLVQVNICPRHGDGGGSGNVRKWQERQHRAGKDPSQRRTGEYITWSDLRPDIERARRTRRTQIHYR